MKGITKISAASTREGTVHAAEKNCESELLSLKLRTARPQVTKASDAATARKPHQYALSKESTHSLWSGETWMVTTPAGALFDAATSVRASAENTSSISSAFPRVRLPREPSCWL